MQNSVSYFYKRLQPTTGLQRGLIRIVLQILTFTAVYRLAPPFARLAMLHVPITVLSLAAFPPAPEIPHIALPVLWGASFAFTYTLSSLFRLPPLRKFAHA